MLSPAKKTVSYCLRLSFFTRNMLAAPNGNIDMGYLGVNGEAYIIGALATALLDRHLPRDVSQTALLEAGTYPLGLLYALFEDAELPTFDPVFTQEDVDVIVSLRAQESLSLQSLMYLLNWQFDAEIVLDDLLDFIDNESLLERIKEGEYFLLNMVLVDHPLASSVTETFTGHTLPTVDRETMEDDSENQPAYLTLAQIVALLDQLVPEQASLTDISRLSLPQNQ